ncbi:MAG: insulinase family protein, partial [Gemmatimonadetes bacterium]|nr:insulinase family protein [Gemmatimonadota bacterium]
AALTARVLADGATRDRSYQEILEALYPMAAGYGYSVDKEMTTFTGRIHEDNLEAYYELFRAALLEPAFDPEDFERIKAQTLNQLERGRRYNRDEELSKELLFWMAYRGTPYEHPEEGYVQSVQSITLEDVEAFYRDHYLRDAVVVGVGGGYPDGFAERVRTDLDALPAGTVRAVPAPEPERPDGMEVLLVEKQTDAVAISMGFPIDLLRGDDDFMAMLAANSWFGEHRNSFSHLYQVIRETRGMNYGDYSYIEAFPAGFATQQPRVNVARRSQLFEIWIRPIALTEPGNLHDRSLFATRAALRELDLLVEQGLDAARVEETVGFLRNYTVNWGNTISRRLAYRMDDAFYGIDQPGYLASLRPALDGLDAGTVSAAVRRHLQADGLYLVMVTQDAEGMKQKLLSGEPTAITYAGPQPDEVLAEDEEIASYPIPVTEEDITIIGIEEVFENR